MLGRRRAAAILAALGVAATLLQMQAAPFRSDISIVHWSEHYHYLLATRYFREVGYTGLYDATVIADHEDDPDGFDRAAPIRSLGTYAMQPRSQVLERAAAVRARFDDARWAAFKRDVAVFRAALGPEWRTARFQQDHGYNGTPLQTLLLGGLSRQPFLSTGTFVRATAWGDTILMLAAAALVARLVGAFEGALLLFAWAANPFNDFMIIGGAYLRSLHFLALVTAALAWWRRRPWLAGAALALATGLRVYPIFLAAGLAAQAALSPRRRADLPRVARCLAAFALVLLVLVLLSSWQPSPEGTNPWVPYLAKIRLHAEQLSYNVVSLQYLFFYGEAHNAAAIAHSWETGRNLNWADEAHKAFAAHRGGYLVALLASAGAIAWCLRRGTPEDGLFAGLAAVFALQHLSHYDWFVLAIVPLLFPEDRRTHLALVGFFMVVCLAIFLPKAAALVDFRFYLLSLLTAAWFGATFALRARPAGAPRGALV